MGIFTHHIEAKQTIVNPSTGELRALASPDEITTEFGSASFVSDARNRSASVTYIVEDGVEIGVQQKGITLARATEILSKVRTYLKDQEVIQVDRMLGSTPGRRLHGRLFITRPYARIAYMWHQSLFAASASDAPDLATIFVPEWPERVIFVHPRHRLTCILGTDYFGESKKSFLRMAMYAIKEEGGIGLHAGSKVLRVRQPDGALKDIGFILFGLSGTGKTVALSFSVPGEVFDALSAMRPGRERQRERQPAH